MSKESGGCGCGCAVVFLVFNLLVGSWLFSYNAEKWLGKTFPWYVDLIGGLVTAEFCIPLAFIAWIHGGPYPILK